MFLWETGSQAEFVGGVTVGILWVCEVRGSEREVFEMGGGDDGRFVGDSELDIGSPTATGSESPSLVDGSEDFLRAYAAIFTSVRIIQYEHIISPSKTVFVYSFQ